MEGSHVVSVVNTLLAPQVHPLRTARGFALALKATLETDLNGSKSKVQSIKIGEITKERPRILFKDVTAFQHEGIMRRPPT